MSETHANRDARVRHRWNEDIDAGKREVESLLQIVREEVQAERLRIVYAVRDIAGLEVAMKVMDATVMPDFLTA